MALVDDLVVLIVEDDEDSRELLEMFLTDHGARVCVAGTAAEARAKIRTQIPDVILTDITLPDEDGFAFVAGLRDDPFTRHVPAIALTGRVDSASRHRALTAGFQHFLSKPLDSRSLPATIREVVEAAKARDGGQGA